MGRAPCCEKVGLKRGRWTAEEDEILTAYIQANGEGSWRSLPKNAGLLRCGKSCRLRWVNYLKSDLKRGKFSSEEDETIIKLHSSLGNRWCLIASHLPGRTDNEIKNYWNSHLSRQLYNFRKIIHQFKQQVVVDQPAAKSEKQQLGRRSRSMMKKNKSHVPTKVQLDPPPQTAELNISTTTLSEEGDNGGGSSTSVIMPGTPALEEHVVMSSTLINEDRKIKDDIVLGSFFDDMISDGLEVNPNWDYADFQGDHEMLFTNDEVENWLIDVNNNTGEAKVDQSLLTDAKSTCDQQDHCLSTNMYSYNNVFDNLGWEWDNLDLIDDDEGHKTWDNEEEKMVSWLWETSSDCDKTESVADSYDKQDAFVEWLLS